MSDFRGSPHERLHQDNECDRIDGVLFTDTMYRADLLGNYPSHPDISIALGNFSQ